MAGSLFNEVLIVHLRHRVKPVVHALDGYTMQVAQLLQWLRPGVKELQNVYVANSNV